MDKISSKMSVLPKVTIIMATYNRAHFIIETLESIQAQTFKNWECLIIDDDGTDNTAVVIAPILEQDSRFQFLIRPANYKKGLPGCRNYGIDLAKGEYVIFFDDDDIIHPQNLELCILEFSKNDIFFCRYILDVFLVDFDYNFNYSTSYTSDRISVKDIEKILKQELQFNSCAIMWKKECFIGNRFVEHLMYAEEWELYPRIISNGFYGISINKILYNSRKHSNSNTGEFYKNDPIRRESYKQAVLLVVQNLKEKQLLSPSLLRYFIQVSIRFKEFHLFKEILNILNFPKLVKFKWHVFYYILPFRLWIYRIFKKIKKI